MISKDQKRWQIAAHVILAVSSALALLPFILLIIISFTDDKTAIENGYSYLPAKWSTGAYEYLLQSTDKFVRAYGMAIAVIGILPILVIYPFFQKYFAKGLVMGAVKG